MDDILQSSGMDSWPVPVMVYTEKENLVKLSELPKSLKGRAWTEIKSSCPPLAELLKKDDLKQIVEFFSASIFIEAHHAPCLPPEPLKGRKPR